MTQIDTEKQNIKTRRQIYWLIFILVSISISSIFVRSFLFSPDKLAGDDQLWRLHIQIDTLKTKQLASVTINPPFDTQYIRTIERNISHPYFKIKNTSTEKNTRRNIQAQAIKKGNLSLSLEFLLHKSQTPFGAARLTTSLTTQQRESYIADSEYFELFSYSVQKQLKELIARQPRQELIVNEIYNHLKKIPMSTKPSTYNVSKILTLKKATTLDRSLAMVALCRAAGIPARLITGVILKPDTNSSPHYWVQAYEDNQWKAYDIHYGYQEYVPDNYLPLKRNGTQIVELLSGKLGKVKIETEQVFNQQLLSHNQEKGFINIFDLSRLPIDNRNQLALLLLLPLGALITALFRHLIGITSYGVFTPTLLALATIYADLATTLVVFIVVSSLAIGGRSFFPSTITRTPRLSIIFTLIAIIMTFSVSILSYLGLGQNDSVVLLPMIILTSLVDRFYRTVEDNGMKIAMRRMIWTLIIALTCLPVIQFESLGHWLIKYPEAHFATLALFLLISTYEGKHFINLPLLKYLAEPENTRKKKTSESPDN